MINKILRIFSFFILIFVIGISLIQINIINEKRYVEVTYKNQKYLFELGIKYSELLDSFNIQNTFNQYDSNYIIENGFILNEIKENKYNLISINQATKDDLLSLPGIGDVIADRIIEYRNEFGSFLRLDDLKNVKGIGDKKYEKIKFLITI